MEKNFTPPLLVLSLSTPTTSVPIGAYEYARPADILYCQGDRNYSHVHLTNGRRVIVSLTLSILEARLAHGKFLRANRSNLLNMHHIKSYDGLRITLINGITVEVARRRRREVRVSLRLFSEKFYLKKKRCA
ncbi:LytTR family transcriptional regulator DNA-binding domain-containing protein [Salmonirosea aquatica]|uniref:HTH LytTR-type domain-containing protein n=1 Tax=Salmonirosea aquatica TaxID=2654236 RepID=A0A7C9F513_9BACT|nr:hypothetical protein [Cytophagaceae bacterium SJW1-29]